jgi:hypothetical protein
MYLNNYVSMFFVYRNCLSVSLNYNFYISITHCICWTCNFVKLKLSMSIHCSIHLCELFVLTLLWFDRLLTPISEYILHFWNWCNRYQSWSLINISVFPLLTKTSDIYKGWKYNAWGHIGFSKRSDFCNVIFHSDVVVPVLVHLSAIIADTNKCKNVLGDCEFGGWDKNNVLKQLCIYVFCI